MQDHLPELRLVLHPKCGNDAVGVSHFRHAYNAPIVITVSGCRDIAIGQADDYIVIPALKVRLPVQNLAGTVTGLGIIHQVLGQRLTGQHLNLGHSQGFHIGGQTLFQPGCHLLRPRIREITIRLDEESAMRAGIFHFSI